MEVQYVKMNEEEKKEEEELGSLEEMKRRILDVQKWPRDMNSRSWTQVVTQMKESPKEWIVLLTLARINPVIFKLKMNKEKREKLKRQWNALPNTALLNIFCKSELKDRLESIPLVCKSWKYVTDDPRCWSSMIPDSVSPEDAFIKNTSCYEFKSYPLTDKSYEFKNTSCYEVPDGLSRLRTLIKKSGGGAAITTLYLKPFLQQFDTKATYDEILHLIANCCPNLKHISFNTVHKASTKALLQLINKCKKLELVDFSYYSYTEMSHSEHRDVPLVLQEMGKCLPNLHGFRASLEPHRIIVPIATYLPQLKLLSIDSSGLLGKQLSNILFCCRELHYLYVRRTWQLLNYSQNIIYQASTQIPEFFYEIPRRCHSDNDYVDMQESTEHILNWDNDYENQYSEETHHFHIDDDFCIDHYRHILKQRKEDQHVSILKEKLKRKKNNQYKSSLEKKKKNNKKKPCAYNCLCRLCNRIKVISYP